MRILNATLLVLALYTAPAGAAETVADSVTENLTPPRIVNFACSTYVGVTSNGSIDVFEGYCPRSSTPSNYTISYNFSLSVHEKMTSIIIWSNAGNGYDDGELQSFDLEVDYTDNTGSANTLLMSGVNIGETLNSSDPKTVLFQQAGLPVELQGVSQVRISNLDGAGSEFVFREVVGDVFPVVVDLQTVKTIVSGASFPEVGEAITYEIEVTNNGGDTAFASTLTDLLPTQLTATAGNGSATNGSYDSISGLWTIAAITGGGGSQTLTLEGTVNGGQEGNTITNVATAADNDANDETNTTGDILSQSVTAGDPNLSITKTASPSSNVAAGSTVTYTYLITNTGNVPISDISINDVHNGFGPFTQPANEVLTSNVSPLGDSFDTGTGLNDGVWEQLGPADEISFTTDYVVTQSDVDNLQ